MCSGARTAMSFGREQLPTFDLAASRYAISFGADFLGTWNSPVAQTARATAACGRAGRGIRGAFVQVEPRMSLTGASADEWVAIRPGTEGVLALGLAHVILREKLRPADAAGRAGALVDGWSKGLADYTPQAVEQKTSVKAARVERLARELAEQRPSVAIIGGAPLAQANGLFQALAVNALNALLGSVGTPGGLSFMPQADAPPPATAVDARCAPLPPIFSPPTSRPCRCCSSTASTRCTRRRRAGASTMPCSRSRSSSASAASWTTPACSRI